MEVEEKKEDRRVKRTKKALFEALFTLLETKSINQISVTELTKMADINRSTFYLYYKDIFDMMDTIQDETYNTFISFLSQATVSTNSPEELFQYCVKFFDFCKENYTVCKFVLKNDCGNSLYSKVIAAVRSMIPNSEAVFNKENDPRYYLTTYCLYACLAVIMEWMNDGMIIPSIDMAKFVCFTYMFGSVRQKNDMYKLYTNNANPID